MSIPFPESTTPADSLAEVLLRYLDYFRAVVLDKVGGLAEADQRMSRLPSGWTPLELVKHLTFVERRWLVWGFEGKQVDDPWGDSRDGRWTVGSDDSAGLLSALADQGRITGQVVGRHDLDEVGRPGERWDGAQPATLERVLLHLVQEYARHVGHLDVVRELVDGTVGE
ncbi:MAG: DinB family protein [Lapillicoccus sp.]